MIDGFWSMYFTGNAGSGVGLLTIHKGLVVGVDAAGASYDGSYKSGPQPETFVVDVTMSAPTGTVPVQTGIPLTAPAQIPIHTTLTSDFGSGRPVLLETPMGPINVVFKKIRDYPA